MFYSPAHLSPAPQHLPSCHHDDELLPVPALSDDSGQSLPSVPVCLCTVTQARSNELALVRRRASGLMAGYHYQDFGAGDLDSLSS